MWDVAPYNFFESGFLLVLAPVAFSLWGVFFGIFFFAGFSLCVFLGRGGCWGGVVSVEWGV